MISGRFGEHHSPAHEMGWEKGPLVYREFISGDIVGFFGVLRQR